MRDLASEFEAERNHLLAVAYRMLGSHSEAEDAVQEAWLRYAAALAGPEARAAVRDLRAWLVTATSRICLDQLRSARVRRETYPGQWLPEPALSPLPGAPALTRVAAPGQDAPARGFAPDPAERAVETEQVGMALLVVLERLTPEQRVAFVLHDVFTVPFAEIATALGTTPAAARQLATRARRAVAEGSPRHDADPAEQRRLLSAFLAATERGDLDTLVKLLAPDVTFVGDAGGYFPSTRLPITGSLRVARFLVTLRKRLAHEVPALRAKPVILLGGTPGLHGAGVRSDGRRLRFVMWFTMEGGRITAVFNQLNPEKLRGVPAPAAATTTWPPAL